MKPKTFTLIAGTLAAEQRTAVAHSASYGSGHPHISQVPAGAKENHFITTQIICRAIRRLNILRYYSHSASYGFNRPQTHQAPVGATENYLSKAYFSLSIQGLNRFANTPPRFHRGLLSFATPWLAKPFRLQPVIARGGKFV